MGPMDTVESLVALMPRSRWKVNWDAGHITLLNRPSWLMGGTKVVQQFLQYMYSDTSWVAGVTTGGEGIAWEFSVLENHTLSEKCVIGFIRTNGMALALWVNSQLVCSLLNTYKDP